VSRGVGMPRGEGRRPTDAGAIPSPNIWNAPDTY